MAECKNQIYSANELDASLIEKLTNVFKESFPHSKRLEIAGILSYTTDDDTEKFLKIDFCSGNQNEATAFVQSLEKTISSPTDSLRSVSPDATNVSISDKLCYRSASPPLLPPLLLQANRQCRLFTRDNVISSMGCQSSAFGKLESDCRVVERRDRRKCRKPKRQPFNLSSTFNEENEDPENNDAFETYCVNSNKRIKVSDENEQSVFLPDQKPGEVTETADAVETGLCSVDPSDKPCSISFSSSPSLVLPIPLQSSNKNFPQCSQKPPNTFSSMTSQVAQARSALSAKTLGLDELGEFCGLPLNTLLGRTVMSNVDNGGLTVKAGGTGSNGNQSVMLTSCETSVQPTSRSLGIPPSVPISSVSNQGVFVNPSLAAAIAAAFTSAVNLPGVPNGLTAYNETNPTNVSQFVGPSIALTGPSGEFLGTIPLSTNNLQQSLLSNSNNALPHNSHSSNVLSSVSIPVPLSTNLGIPSNLVNTLNWLRNASAAVDSPTQQTVSSISVPTNEIAPSNVSTSGSVAFTGQNLHQPISASVSAKPHPLTSISVGPTLALIGTLGLNSNTHCSLTSSGGNANPSLTISSAHGINMSMPGSNSAALVAAALLRGLANARQSQQESDNNSGETSINNSAGSITLIASTNNGKSSLCSSDVPLGSFNSILTSKAITPSPLNVQCASSIGVETSNPLMATILNRCASDSTSRGSIMFSYPRVTGEMNLLLAPASVPSVTGSQSTIPTAIAFQNIPGPLASAISTTTSVILQPSLSSQTTSKCTTLVTSTSTTSCTISVAPLQQSTRLKVDGASGVPQNGVNNDEKSRQISQPDPTASAIDRILQTIKGCMNTAENRENESKIKFHSTATKLVSTGLEASAAALSKSGGADNLGNKDEPKKMFSVRLAPVAVCIGKESLRSSEYEPSQNQPDFTKISVGTAERVPLTPLAKSINETDSLVNGVPRVYRCRYCGKSFNRKFCRERHERLHTGVKPYTCEICDEKFIRLEDKKRHVRSLQHCLAGRAAAVKVGSAALCDINRSRPTSESPSAQPAFCLAPNGVATDCTDDNFAEADDIVGIGTSEETSNDRDSECESSDAEDGSNRELEISIDDNPYQDAHSENQCLETHEEAFAKEKDEPDETAKGNSLTFKICTSGSKDRYLAAASEATSPSCQPISVLNPVVNLGTDAICVSSVVTH